MQLSARSRAPRRDPRPYLRDHMRSRSWLRALRFWIEHELLARRGARASANGRRHDAA